jgi:cyclopropane fatty-acyl-phospholipid synthase-like methyltransferase
MKETWDQKYSGTEYFYGVQPNSFLSSVSGVLSNSSQILCIAEGEGRNAVYLASLGHRVTAVDFSLEGQKKALSLAKSQGVTIDYQLSSLEDFNFKINHWDAVVSIFCHLPQTIRFHIHNKIQESLRPGGCFILEAYQPEQLNFNTGGPRDLSMLYTKEILTGDFAKIQWLRLDYSKKEIFEGIGHTGRSSVVNAIGFKMGSGLV